MHKHGKKYLAALAKIDPEKAYSSREAVALAKTTSFTKFDASVEVHLRMGLDPRQAEQQVRDVVVLPHGLGKSVRVLVFAGSEGAALARQLAGASASLSGSTISSEAPAPSAALGQPFLLS